MRNILFILLIGVSCCQEPIDVKETSAGPDNKPVVTVRLADLDGKPIDLHQFKGSTVFINCWATWCKPCIREMPTIENARELLRNKKVVFLLASNESPDQISEFTKEHNFNLNYVRLTNMEELNIEGLPTTYIFNPKGELVFAESGYRKWDDSSNIRMLLEINNQQ